jgi:hypothetical protein
MSFVARRLAAFSTVMILLAASGSGALAQNESGATDTEINNLTGSRVTERILLQGTRAISETILLHAPVRYSTAGAYSTYPN